MSENTSGYGRLIGVSLGPGDPELITLKAYRALKSSAHWTYPVRKKGAESFALQIVLDAGLTLPEKSTELVFPMTHDPGKLAKYWENAANAVISELIKGIDVIFLVEGDASTYSTFGHLMRTVLENEPNIETEVIAGVSSFNAAAAIAGQVLVEVDDTMAIVPAGYGVKWIETLMRDFDTLVLMKVKPLLDDIIALVERRGIVENCCFVEKAGTKEERIISDIGTLKGETVNYLSLIIIHNPDRERGKLLRGCRKKT
jgi:precorrin-2/cobalt-factor-2 C20-methyltransferase